MEEWVFEIVLTVVGLARFMKNAARRRASSINAAVAAAAGVLSDMVVVVMVDSGDGSGE
jgi:hypothetical protein